MLTPEQIEECARAASKHSATLGQGDVLAWMTRGEYLRLARAIEAATLATVTPLLRQAMWAMTTCGVNDGYEGPRQCFDEDQIDAAKEAIGAFLSGATKGEPS